MPEIIVAAESRSETGKNANRRLRVSGKIPGVLYGEKKQPMQIAVAPKEIAAILRSASGENTLFDLQLDGGRRKVILKEFQQEPLKGRLIHADFYEVALDKELHVKVHVELVGTAIGVKRDGGVLDFVTRELEIACLPTNIPEKISVDVSELEIGKHLRVHDLKLPEKIRLLTDAELVVVHVVVARAEEAAPTAEAAAATAAEPEVIKKGKAEAEGEEKAEAAPAKGGDKKDKK
jgi:large subunit ribosomal protein L25